MNFWGVGENDFLPKGKLKICFLSTLKNSVSILERIDNSSIDFLTNSCSFTLIEGVHGKRP